MKALQENIKAIFIIPKAWEEFSKQDANLECKEKQRMLFNCKSKNFI